MNKKTSKYLSLLLRHKPEKENLNIDSNGYVLVNEICTKLNLSKSELDNIVATNDKKRFAYNNDQTKIRASQGHSINVNVELKKILPPILLYHGTTTDNNNKIMASGLLKMSRQHVHLTNDIEVATQVGMRYAKYKNKLIIYKIDSEKMNKDKYEFFISENGVYLTDYVPSKYIIGII